MTERKKLSLNKAAQPESQDKPFRKPPVRGVAPRTRMSATEAAKAREEAAQRPPAESRYRDERPSRPYEARDDRPAQRPRSQRSDPDAWGDRPAARQRTDAAGRGPRQDAPRRGDDRFDRRDERRDDRRDERRDERRAGPYGDARPGQRPARPPARPARDDRSYAAPRAPRPAPVVSEQDHDGRVRLSKLMSERGLASRREADEWIEHGWVRVDGEVVSELGTRVRPDQEITIDPEARTQQAQRVTILLHKPMGFVSGQAEDGYEPAVTLITPENRWRDDRLPIKLTRGHLRNLAPCGRLDIDSTGLLVLSQDGRIAKQLIGEDSGIEKEYLVRVQWMPQPDAENVSAVVPPEALNQLRHGLELDGRQLKPAQVSWQNEHQLRFVLREGRKRQIRRMCELVGLKVVGLKRVRMGRITLGKLPAGQWRFLRPDERF